MFLNFTAVTMLGETITSNSIIQKEMPYGLDVRLYVEGRRWVRIKNETLKIDINETLSSI